MRNRLVLLTLYLTCGGFSGGWESSCVAEQIFQLRNGMVIRGTMVEKATLQKGFGASSENQSGIKPIWMIDDGLRRHYIHGRGMVSLPPVDQPNLDQTIEIWQQRPLGGKAINGLGTIQGVSKFDSFGRRQVVVRSSQGPQKIFQGISEINPRYAKLISVRVPPGKSLKNLLWDMRVATSSINTSTLRQIFERRMDQSSLDSRFEVVRFYIAAERFGDAREEVEKMLKDFPAEEERLRQMVVSLTERQASQLLDEVKLRASSGQYQLAQDILGRFPKDQAGRTTKEEVKAVMGDIEDAHLRARKVGERLQVQVAQLDEAVQARLQPITAEIVAGLSPQTITRMSDYVRLGDSDTIPIDNRVALGIAGWVLGAGSGEQNLNIAISLYAVRDLVAEYLRSTDTNRRNAILGELETLEGAQPEYVDRILPRLAPTLPWPEDSMVSVAELQPTATEPGQVESNVERIHGYYRVDTERTRYLVQLPPEYNPLRSYPCIVSLHPAGMDPVSQINWWCGPYDQSLKARLGHAARHGVIVVAPLWSRPTQRRYEYTQAEHERVLVAMRDAMRRCSIDSDRVFMAGHGEGGSAAWDIALAHPDLYAGMIAISATPDKTIHHYEENAKYVPLYIVMGQLDKNQAHGGIIDDYMSFNHDAMVVEYRGRGREYFYDEVPRLFQWMSTKAHVRRPIPEEFEVSVIRAGDQFYWWLELMDLNQEYAINPILWGEAERTRSATIEGVIGAGNSIRFSGPASHFNILLRPQPGIDLAEPILVKYGTRTLRGNYDGDLRTMLEDARQRADRKRAVWFEMAVP